MADIRRLEDETKEELDRVSYTLPIHHWDRSWSVVFSLQQRNQGTVRGLKAENDWTKRQPIYIVHMASGKCSLHWLPRAFSSPPSLLRSKLQKLSFSLELVFPESAATAPPRSRGTLCVSIKTFFLQINRVCVWVYTRYYQPFNVERASSTVVHRSANQYNC